MIWLQGAKRQILTPTLHPISIVRQTVTSRVGSLSFMGTVSHALPASSRGSPAALLGDRSVY